MRIIADLHVHSKYSRATSKMMDLAHMAEFAKYKGINLLATGDFTHPKWLNELRLNLKEDGSGFLTYQKEKIRFILSCEISSIYSQGGKTRRIHTVIIMPNLKSAIGLHQKLVSLGANVFSDGRPIIGLSAKQLAEIALEISPKSLIIPAHAWTPWFSIFGSKSGFDSIEECYEDLASEIYAIETGLSSDPEMNWRLSSLDKITLISNSDAHSAPNLGREANVFELENFTYDDLVGAIKAKDSSKLLYTIEFFPEEGMYHFDGHRACQIVIDPFKKPVRRQAGQYKNDLCPICKKPLTIGVANRVLQLADRPSVAKAKNNKITSSFPGYKKLIPLQEIIADTFGVGKLSQRVQREYFKMVNQAPELEILLNFSDEELLQFDHNIAQGIKKVRNGDLFIEPGYDGVYGKVKIFNNVKAQRSLFS